MTLKLTKLMTEAYSMNKFYIWIHNWAVGVKHTSSFSSTFDYQQFQSSNNTCFFTFYYPSTASATISVIKSVTSSALFTAVVSTVISNHIPTTFDSHVQSSLNKTEKQCCCDNNLCSYYEKSDHWLSNCLWKHIIHINEITFQTSLSEQLMIKTFPVLINASESHLENKQSSWIVAQKTSNQHWEYQAQITRVILLKLWCLITSACNVC